MVKPPPADLRLLLVDVLAHIPDRRAVIAVQLDSGREPDAPLRQIVNDVTAVRKPLLALYAAFRTARLPTLGWNDRAAVNDAKRVIDEPVEMDSPVLVKLRDKDVFQPMPPHGVVEPAIKLPRDRLDIVTVNLAAIERQGHEIPKVITQRKVTDLRPRPALSAKPRLDRRFFDRPLVNRDLRLAFSLRVLSFGR